MRLHHLRCQWEIHDLRAQEDRLQDYNPEYQLYPFTQNIMVTQAMTSLDTIGLAVTGKS